MRTLVAAADNDYDREWLLTILAIAMRKSLRIRNR